MNTIEDIKAAIVQLPPGQIEKIRIWLTDLAESLWDAQIERDACEGKLDGLAEKALADYHSGRTRHLAPEDASFRGSERRL